MEEQNVREDRDEPDEHPRHAARHEPDADSEAAEEQQTARRVACHAFQIYRGTM
jgi:hypothetical protein